MPAKNPWQYDVNQLNNKGLDVIHPIEQVDKDHYSRMEDVKSLQEGTITPRPGTSLINAVALQSSGPIITALDLKQHGDGSNNTQYTSSPPFIDFKDNKLYLCAVFGRSAGGGPVTVSSIVAGSLTWVKVAEIQFKTIASTTAVCAVFRALGTGTTDTSLTFTYSTTVQTGLMQLTEFSNVDLTGTNGSGAIVQSDTFASDSTAAPLVTLAAFGSVQNATYGAFSDGESGGTVVAGSGFAGFTMPSPTTLTEWRNDNDTTVDASAGGATAFGAIGIEIKAP